MTSQRSHVMAMWFYAFFWHFLCRSWSSLFSLKTETHSHQLNAIWFSFSLNSGVVVFSHKNNQLSHLLQHLLLSLCESSLPLFLLSWSPLLLHQRGSKQELWGLEGALRAGFQEIMSSLKGIALKLAQRWSTTLKLFPLIGWKAKS